MDRGTGGRLRERAGQLLAGLRQWGREILSTQLRYTRLLGADLPEFRQTVDTENLRRTRVGALGLWVINAMGFLAYYPRLGDPALSQPYYRHLVELYLVSVVVCFLYGPSATVVLARRPSGPLSRILTWLFLVWLFWLGIAFTVNGQNQLDHLTNYLFALVFVAVVFSLPALPSLALYAASYVVLFLWLAVVQEDPVTLVAGRGNAFSACLLAYLVSRVTFSSRLTSFTRTKLIERQAIELAQERNAHRFDQFCLAFELTKREREILRLVLDGMANQDIARQVFVSHDTVKKHVYHIFQKAGVGTRFELARFIENGNYGDGTSAGTGS